jgi:hypothetical protein
VVLCKNQGSKPASDENVQFVKNQSYYDFAMTKPTIINEFLHESFVVFRKFSSFFLGGLLGLLVFRGFGFRFFFLEWLPLCILHQFGIPFFLIVLAFTL